MTMKRNVFAEFSALGGGISTLRVPRFAATLAALPANVMAARLLFVS